MGGRKSNNRSFFGQVLSPYALRAQHIQSAHRFALCSPPSFRIFHFPKTKLTRVRPRLIEDLLAGMVRVHKA